MVYVLCHSVEPLSPNVLFIWLMIAILGAKVKKSPCLCHRFLEVWTTAQFHFRGMNLPVAMFAGVQKLVKTQRLRKILEVEMRKTEW